MLWRPSAWCETDIEIGIDIIVGIDVAVDIGIDSDIDIDADVDIDMDIGIAMYVARISIPMFPNQSQGRAGWHIVLTGLLLTSLET